MEADRLEADGMESDRMEAQNGSELNGSGLTGSGRNGSTEWKRTEWKHRIETDRMEDEGAGLLILSLGTESPLPMPPALSVFPASRLILFDNLSSPLLLPEYFSPKINRATTRD